jgi:aspartate/tyrosine/aromatic aminotransferase
MQTYVRITWGDLFKMTYEYFDFDGTKLQFKSFIDAVRDVRVYRIIVINEIARNIYLRSGAGWKRDDS